MKRNRNRYILLIVIISLLGLNFSFISIDTQLEYDDINSMNMPKNKRSGSWQYEFIDNIWGSSATFPAISIDNNNNPHVLYKKVNADKLIYARWDSSNGWTETVIEENCYPFSVFSSIDTDSDNNPHLVYMIVDGGFYYLKYKHYNGATWSEHDIESLSDPFNDFSIDTDSNDNPHIAYVDNDFNLKYAKKETSWSKETIETSVSYSTDIVVSESNIPYISYSNDNNIKCCYKSGGGWTKEIVDSWEIGYVTYFSITLRNSLPSICYSHSEKSGNGPLLLSYRDVPGSWHNRTIDNMNCDYDAISFKIDTNNYAHICYLGFDDPLNPTHHYMKYAYGYYSTSNWDITTLKESGESYFPDIDVDSNNEPHIFYYDKGNHAVYYTTTASRVPNQPAGVTAEGGDGNVTLSWSAPGFIGSSAITNYKIYRGPSSGSQSHLVTLGNVTGFLDTGLSNGDTYYYMITAVNGVGEGPYSSEVSGTAGRPPSKPLDLQAEPGSAFVSLSWSPPGDTGGLPVNDYHVYRSTTPGNETHLVTLGDVTSYNDGSVSNGQPYYYNVSAENDKGESPLSEEAWTVPGIPHEPLGFQGKGQYGSVLLNWTEPEDVGASAITNYTIYRGIEAGNLNQYVTLDPVNDYEDTGVTNGQNYFYQVTAINQYGEGLFSSEIAVTPGTAPFAPQSLSAERGDGSVDLEWSPPSDNGGFPLSGYNLYRGTSSNGETLIESLSTVTEYTDYDVINGIEYFYKISAINSLGEGPFSQEVSAMPGTYPSEPLSLCTEGGDGMVTLTWADPSTDGGSPITCYKVFRGQGPGEESYLASVDASLGNEYIDDSVINGNTYYYSLRALNDIGEGPMSNDVNATPLAELGLDIMATPNSLTSGGSSMIKVYVTYEGLPLEYVKVNMSRSGGGFFSTTEGYSGSDGYFTTTYNSPAVEKKTAVNITAKVSKFGFETSSININIIINPEMVRDPLQASVYCNPSSLMTGDNTMVTVNVSSKGNPVNNAILVLDDGGAGGTLGTIEMSNNGRYTATYGTPLLSASTLITVRVNVTKAGYNDTSVSTKLHVFPEPVSALISPQCGEQIACTSVTLSWELRNVDNFTMDEEITYDVYISRDSPAPSKEFSSLHVTRAEATGLSKGLHYWYVIPRILGYRGACLSGSWNFTVTVPFEGDADGDGLPDSWESYYDLDTGGNDGSLDPDEDGLTNLQEYLNDTNPLESDTDGDGMPDGWEVSSGLDPLSSDSPEDPDNDGLTNLQEYLNNTEPLDPDTDNDGISDGYEISHGLDAQSNTDALMDEDGDGLTNLQEYLNGTDPNNDDTDGDGLPDGWEVDNGLDPLDDTDGTFDGDGDGLTNLEEFLNGTNPNDADTDGDGMPDGWELDNDLDPLMRDGAEDRDSDGLNNLQEFVKNTSANESDTDGDGMPDGWEVKYGLDPLDPDDGAEDSDDDGLSNLQEYVDGTSPLEPNIEASDKGKQSDMTIYLIIIVVVILISVFAALFLWKKREGKKEDFEVVRERIHRYILLNPGETVNSISTGTDYPVIDVERAVEELKRSQKAKTRYEEGNTLIYGKE